MSRSGKMKMVGRKGAKLTPQAGESVEGLLQALAPLGGAQAKKMFGGYGVFRDGTMFSLVDSSGQAFLRVDDQSRADFEAAGSTSHGRMPYMSIPDGVAADKKALVKWAKRSLVIARAAKK